MPLGAILILMGWATLAQVDQALIEQRHLRQDGRVERLGEILVRQGVVRPEHVERVIAEQPTFATWAT